MTNGTYTSIHPITQTSPTHRVTALSDILALAPIRNPKTHWRDVMWDCTGVVVSIYAVRDAKDVQEVVTASGVLSILSQLDKING